MDGPASTLVDRFCILTALTTDYGSNRSTLTPAPRVASSPSVESVVFEDESTLLWDVASSVDDILISTCT